jgi:hypothetical protein
MGQELLEIPDNNYAFRRKRKYYLATNSKGHKVVRGTTEKKYTHATIHNDLYASGYCYATFTTRLDLAKRYARAWGDNAEVVEVLEITSKEARQHKKDINNTAHNHQEQEANRIAGVYEIERGAI